MTRASIALAAACCSLLAGCRGGAVGPYTPAWADSRDPWKAQALTLQAAEIAHKNPAESEALLREALTADLYHGPAHNNLGVLFLTRGELYSAASEFEWARKLCPGAPDPRMNLALALEKAGRTAEAITAYSTALEVAPEHVPSMQALTRLQLASGRPDERTPRMLSEIALRGETQQWRDWARTQGVRFDH